MIDEKKLIERIKEEPTDGMYTHEIIEAIEEQPKIGEWIPCSERMPEPGKRYSITAVWNDGEKEVARKVYYAVYGSDGLWHTHDYSPASYEVIAWQPLPEPYHE